MSNPWIRFSIPCAGGELSLVLHSKTGKTGVLSYRQPDGELIHPQLAYWNEKQYAILRDQARAWIAANL